MLYTDETNNSCYPLSFLNRDFRRPAGNYHPSPAFYFHLFKLQKDKLLFTFYCDTLFLLRPSSYANIWIYSSNALV